jgi:hypothetical protein
MCYLTDGAGAGACAEQFVGAVALATFSVRKLDGTAAAAFIHERVTLISQSQGLPARLPYSMSQKAEKGIVSDIQAFGYDQAPLSHAERLRARRESSRTWRLYRQELYVDRHTRPFAIVEWRHAVDRIDLVRIYAPPEREALRPRLAEAHLPR